MRVRIKQIDTSLPLPKYETSGSVGFDILARQTTTISPSAIELIPGNIIIEVPKGYMMAIVSRSSTPRRRGLESPQGIGVVDQDYHGPEDEIKIQVRNFTKQTVIVQRGDKIAQGIFFPVAIVEWDVSNRHLKFTSRGGFGSTSSSKDRKIKKSKG